MKIKFIDIMEKDVYVEFMQNEFNYLSFSKTKKLIWEQLPTCIIYNCAEHEKSRAFLNTLLNKYKSVDNLLILK
ncbi:MAG: hypothetical protein AB7V28_01190 [Arcobacteraceae bacterium]